MNVQITTPPIKLLNRAQLTTLKIPPRKPLLGDWLVERTPCLIYAKTGRGKSLFTMSLAIAVAGGGCVFDWDAPEARHVLYIDAEMDIADVKDRDQLLAHCVEGLDEEALNTNLTILSRHYQDPDTIFPDLVEKAGVEALLKMVNTLKPSLVILDNLSTMASIRDENDATAFAPVIRTLGKLKSAGCAVILVHHTGKQEGKYRGSSNLETTFESTLQLAVNKDLLKGEAGFSLIVDKDRRGVGPSSFDCQLVTNRDTGRKNWEIGQLQEKQLDELVQMIRSLQYKTANEIAYELDVTKSTISKWKAKAISLGKITDTEWKDCLTKARF